MRILVTGGTVFVSKYVAQYYVNKGDQVYVLNRNNHPQVSGVTLIEGDRKNLGEKLKGYQFDAVLDITPYCGEDVNCLLDALQESDTEILDSVLEDGAEMSDAVLEDDVACTNYVKNPISRRPVYLMISSSAVYPETQPQPFREDSLLGENKFWGAYGTNKIEAEKALLERIPDAYILRPPYLYGPMNNVYREAFVFECARKHRKFYLPKDGSMKLQFFHVKDLCKLIDVVMEKRPQQHIFNVGNETSVSIREWAELCYQIAGEKPEFVEVHEKIEQRNYFSFYNYEYMLDVTEQKKLLPETKNLEEGLQEAYDWYVEHEDEVVRKPYLAYIDENF